MSEQKQQKKTALAPRLRFPEFREAGEWIAKELKDACDVNPANSELPKKFVYIDLESVESGELKTRKITNRDDAPSRAQRLLRYGDVIFQIVRPYQRNNLLFKIDEDVHYVASTGYAQFRANESEDFLFQAVHTDDFVERVIAKCTGSSYPAINSSDLAKIPIAIPRYAEQQIIAACLSSLDDLIAAQNQKLDALKTHKKGLMQQLFPRDGETVPCLRFPEFRDAGEWEEKSVGKVFSITRGEVLAMPQVKEIPSEDFPYPVYSSQTKNNGLAGYFSRYLYKNAITWTTDGANAGEVNFRQGKFFCTNVCGVLLNSNGWANPFVAALLNSVTRKYVSYVGNPKLMNGVMSEIVVPFPSLPEQQTIAACLSSLDDLIAAQSQKIDALKRHKKGLMQQLFPVMDEVRA